MSAVDSGFNPPNIPFMAKLKMAVESASRSDEDPWVPRLRKLKGRVGRDGIERIATHDVFDALGIQIRHRARLTVRLSRLMHRLGWTNIRARGLNSGSYRDRVRGYAREAPDHPATSRGPCKF